MLYNTNKFNVLSHTIMPLLTSIVAFTFVPIFMIGNNPEDFTFVDIEMFFKSSLFYAIFYGLLLVAINIVFLLFKQRKLSTLFLYSYFHGLPSCLNKIQIPIR